jgi:hypothetical protein
VVRGPAVDRNDTSDENCRPLLRDRAVLDPSLTKSNRFYREFIALLSFHWPYQTEEAFGIDPITGLYTFSGLYENHFRDLRMWRMHTDFFRSFPDAFDDITPNIPIPMQIQSMPAPRVQRVIEAAPTSDLLNSEGEDFDTTLQQTHVFQQPIWELSAGASDAFFSTYG